MLGFFKKTKPAGASDSHASAPVSKDSTLPTAPSKNTSTVNASEEAHSARESNTNTGTELDHANDASNSSDTSINPEDKKANWNPLSTLIKRKSLSDEDHLRKAGKQRGHNHLLFFAVFLAFTGSTLLLLGKVIYCLVFGMSLSSVLDHLLQLVFLCIACCFVAHRVLGYVAGLALRCYLRKSLSERPELFDISFQWISYRGFLDHNEIVFHGVTWSNPVAFARTPFLLHIDEVRVSVSAQDLINTRFFSNKQIIIKELIIDGLELYIERADDKKVNLFCAMSDSSAATKDEPGRPSMSTRMQKVIEKIGSSFSRLTEGGVGNVITKMKKPFDSKKKELAPVAGGPGTMCIGRVMILNARLHIADFLCAYHLPASEGSDVYVAELVLLHARDLSGPGGVTLATDAFISELLDDIIRNVVLGNSAAITKLLALSAANHTSAMAMSAVHTTTHFFGSIGTIGSNIGSSMLARSSSSGDKADPAKSSNVAQTN